MGACFGWDRRICPEDIAAHVTFFPPNSSVLPCGRLPSGHLLFARPLPSSPRPPSPLPEHSWGPGAALMGRCSWAPVLSALVPGWPRVTCGCQRVLGEDAGAVGCFPSLSLARRWGREQMPHSATFCPGPGELTLEPAPLSTLGRWYKWCLLSAALMVWVCFCCCLREPGTGLALFGPAPHMCDRVVTPLAQHVWLSASCPAPQPAGRGGPSGVGEGLGDHMTARQAQPAAQLPVRPMAHCRAAI